MILGLFGFAGATFIVAARLAGWYGSTNSGAFLFPLAAMFGGLAQFMAGMWAFRARDGIATAMHGMWGSFWLGHGILNLLAAAAALALPTGKFPELGFWFLALAAITLAGAIAALFESLGLSRCWHRWRPAGPVAKQTPADRSTLWTPPPRRRPRVQRSPPADGT